MTNLSSQRTVDADHPWLGLTPYTEETREYFFGRDEEVRELFLRVREQPLTILFGQSGLGKTSLLGAGLIPKLRVEGFRPTLLRLGFEAGDPPLIEQAHFTLAHSTNTQSASLVPVARTSTLWEQFHQLSARPADLQTSLPVVIFDQFEEIFTLASSKERQVEANELFRQLADLIENRPPQAVQDRMRSDRRSAREYDLGPSPVRVVITLREDFLSDLEAWKKLMPSLMRNRMALHMLNGPQALEAVVRPGRLQGRNLVSDEVGGRIVRFVANRPPETPLEEIGAVPPLLSLLCDELNQLRIAQHQPMIASDKDSLSGLESLGRNILDEFYTRSFAGLHSSVRDYIEDRMVTVGGHRNPIAFEDALADLQAFAVEKPSAAINQLIQGRLLSIEDRNGVQRLEITHDVLTPLVVRSRDERRERQRAEKAERERAAAAERELLVRRERRRLQFIAIAMGVLSLLAICGMAWAIIASKNAQRQEKYANSARMKSEIISKDLALRQKDLEAANARSTALLGEAAQADRITARHLWELGRRGDALAHWSRSLEYEPDSSVELEQIITRISTVTWPQSMAMLKGHADDVSSASFNPDGTRVLTTSKDKTTRVWDAKTHQLLFMLIGHEDVVNSATYSPDGTRIATSSSDKTARIWDATNGRLLVTLAGHEDGVITAVFNRDGNQIVTGSEDHTARIWNAITGELIATSSGHDSQINSVEFSTDGKRVVTSAYETAYIWDTSTGELLLKLTGHTRWIEQARFSPDETRIVTSSVDTTARVWDAMTGQPIATLEGHTGHVVSASFSPDGTRIVTSSGDYHEGIIDRSGDNTAKIWDGVTGELIATLTGHVAAVNGATFSSDGTRILTCSDDQTARIWDGISGEPIASLRGHRDAVTSALFNSDATQIVTSSRDNTARIWDGTSGMQNAPLILSGTFGDNAQFSPDGTQIVGTEGYPNKALFWDTTTGQAVATLAGHESSVTSATFSSDGKLILTNSRDKTARIWGQATGQTITLLGHQGTVTSALFSPDGTRVATISDDRTVKIWDPTTGHEISTLTEPVSWRKIATFSPDGERIVTHCDDKTARIWDTTTGKAVITLTGHLSYLTSATFNPDGTRIVTSSYDKTARIWDATTGKAVITLTGHLSDLTSATFSPDGTRIVTSAHDKTARIWDAMTGQEIARLVGHQDVVESASFSADGSRIATVSRDKTARIWDATTGKWLATLAGRERERGISSVTFSPDGTQILTNSSFEPSRIWNLAAVKAAPPEWFSPFLTLLGRRAHNFNGELADWPEIADEAAVVEKLQLAISADRSRYGDIARVFLTPVVERPIHAGSRMTNGEAADQLIRPTASRWELIRAHGWNPGHPLIQIALAKFERNETRAAFLREYGVSRLLKRQSSEKETAAQIAELCRRAEAFLIDQNDQPRAELVRKRAEELEVIQ